MSTLCRRFPEDSAISTAFINATALHIRNPDTVKKTAKTYLAARKDDLVLWEALGALWRACQVLRNASFWNMVFRLCTKFQEFH
jgi:hypothetical protein